MEWPDSQGSLGGKDSLRLIEFRKASSKGFSPQTISGAKERMNTALASTAKNTTSTEAT